MVEKKVFVVVGATGIQGGSVVNSLLSKGSWTVRGITRNASSAKAKALTARGVDVVEANLNDLSSLEKAFAGAHAIFTVTDFWALYQEAATSGVELKPGQALNQWAFDAELEQGKNIFDAAARATSLERLIFSSLSNAKKFSGGKYTQVLHFDAKALAVEYGQSKYPELFSKTDVIQLGFYLTNFSQHPWLMPHKNDESDVYEFKVVGGSSAPAPMVAAELDTGALTLSLLSNKPGKTLAAFREWMSIDDFVKLWSKLLGVDGRVVAQETMDQLPSDLKQELEETFAYAEEFGFFGEKAGASVVNPKDIDASVNLGTVEGWIKEQDWSNVIKS